MEKTIFFAQEGEKGLNETSAQHLCAIASQIKEADETMLLNVSFVDTTIGIVGSSEQLPTAKGMTADQLPQLKEAVERVGRLNAFISFYAEGRKVLEKYRAERNRLTLDQWLEEQGRTVPSYPELESEKDQTTLQDVINNMNIKERTEYLALEAKVSVYGKFIHPDRPMARAKSLMWKVFNAPYGVEGKGKDTIVYKHTPSLHPQDVDAMFATMQAEYRSLEQNLNRIKGQLRKKLAAINVEETNARQTRIQEWKGEVKLYNQQMAELQAEFNTWRVEENERLSRIKFAIPEALAPVVAELNNYGK